MAAAVTHAPAPAGWLALQYAIVLSWLLLGADRTVAEQPIRTIVRGWLPSAQPPKAAKAAAAAMHTAPAAVLASSDSTH